MNFVIMLLSLFIVVFNFLDAPLNGIYIVSELGGAGKVVIYAVSTYCIGNVITLPLGKENTFSLSEQQLYILCFSIMAFSSLGCALSPNYFIFLIFCLAEGKGAGPLYLILYAKIDSIICPQIAEFFSVANTVNFFCQHTSNWRKLGRLDCLRLPLEVSFLFQHAGYIPVDTLYNTFKNTHFSGKKNAFS